MHRYSVSDVETFLSQNHDIIDSDEQRKILSCAQSMAMKNGAISDIRLGNILGGYQDYFHAFFGPGDQGENLDPLTHVGAV